MLKKLAKFLLGSILVLVVIAVVTYKPLPDNSERMVSQVLPINPEGNIAQHFLAQIQQHPQLSGVYPLQDGKEAFLARMALAETAQYTLDVQYYIWRNDVSGRLLTQSLYKAAERGVRVRLLLDDMNTVGLDDMLISLDNHPNIEVRLFNPFMQRGFRPVGYLSDFFRLNRRMHNKSMTADGMITIIGGRNVGDEYFDAGTGVMFADLDVAAVGQAAQDVGQDFDRYWASESVYPAQSIIIKATATAIDSAPSSDEETKAYLTALSQLPFAKQLADGSLPLEWVKTTLVSDDPAKGLGKALPDNTVLAHIMPVMAAAEHELLIISPYFVPTAKGKDLLGQVAQSDKNTIVLTNALSATDVAAVHAGYAKYRKDLLKSGVKLFELKPDATVTVDKHGGLTGSTGASLHAKTFAIDGKTLFVGSFNMDPRSAELNAEMGFLIDSPTLAQGLVDGFNTQKDTHTYIVALTDKNDLQWQTSVNGQPVAYDTEPESGFFKRLTVFICALLPIERLL